MKCIRWRAITSSDSSKQFILTAYNRHYLYWPLRYKNKYFITDFIIFFFLYYCFIDFTLFLFINNSRIYVSDLYLYIIFFHYILFIDLFFFFHTDYTFTFYEKNNMNFFFFFIGQIICTKFLLHWILFRYYFFFLSTLR